MWDDDANPAGQVPYTTNNGLATDQAYVNLVLASPLAPEEAMAAFIGENPNGTWTITISDDLAGDGGSLDTWTLNFATSAGCKASPTITTQASGGVLLGGLVQDVATLANGNNPTGDVTFRLFSDPACTTQVFTTTNAVVGGTTATSGQFMPAAAGTRFWTAVSTATP